MSNPTIEIVDRRPTVAIRRGTSVTVRHRVVSVGVSLSGPRVVTIARGPRGLKGDTGDQGDTGEGVPTGGTTGQVLGKASDDDYDWAWITLDDGSVTWDDVTGKPSTFAPSAHTHPISAITSLQATLDGKVDENSAITPATKTKITYDAKGLVTAGADATTADIAPAGDRQYLTAAQLVVVGNTSGTNTGDQDLGGYVPTTRTINGYDLDENRTLTASDVGADATGTAASAVATHAALASGVHGITSYSATLLDDTTASAWRTTLGLGGSATLNVGTTAGTVAAGDDSRLINSRTPTAHASSHAAAGSDPLTLAQSQVTGLTSALAAKLDANTTITGATKTKITYDADGLVTAGADATTADVADSTDRRYLTDAQLAALHAAVTVSDSSTVDLSLTGQALSAAVIPAGIKLDDLATPDDNTDLNASISRHGLLRKLSNDQYTWLDGQGGWTAPTTAHVSATTNKNYVTDAQQAVLGSTSGTNTGDQDAADVPVDDSTFLMLAGGEDVQASIGMIDSSLFGLSNAVASLSMFKTIAVSGQSNVVADSSTDTLTLAAGTSVAITTNASTDTITIGVTGLAIGTNVQAYDATLAALAAYNTSGIVTQTAADTFTGRTITGTANEITVTNGSGVSGNPTISLPSTVSFTGKTVSGLTSSTVGLGNVTNDAQIAKAIVDAKGDLITATADNTPARLAIGVTNGHVLTVDSAEATGMKWAAASGGGGISDGDKGDITVSSSGATWTIDADAVTYAKIQDVSATDRLLGRSTAGAGVVEEITCTAFARSILDDAAASDVRTTLGLGTAAVESAKSFGRTGMTVANNATDANNDIDFAAGETWVPQFSTHFSLSSTLVKRLDAAWAAGTGNGGLFSGTKANSTWYHLFYIKKVSDGTIDAGFSTSLTASDIPSGYTAYWRAGAVQTDSSGVIRAFFQNGDSFLWKVPVVDRNGANVSTTATLVTLTVPLGVKVRPSLSTAAGYKVSTAPGLYLSSPDVDDVACAFPDAMTHAANTTNISTASGDHNHLLFTNTSSQIRVRASLADVPVWITTSGWIDTRSEGGIVSGTSGAVVSPASQATTDAGTNDVDYLTSLKLFTNHDRRLRIRYGASTASYSTDLFAEQEHDPTARGFTWFSQNGMTFDATTGVLSVPDSESGNGGLYCDVPAGNWDFAIWFDMWSRDNVAYGSSGGNYSPFGGIFLSDATKIEHWGESSNSANNATYPHRYQLRSTWSNSTTFAAQDTTSTCVPGQYRAYRLRNVSGTVSFMASRDGVGWDQVTTKALTNYIASPTKIGILAGVTGAKGMFMKIHAFRRLG
jgi:hypothetical protein